MSKNKSVLSNNDKARHAGKGAFERGIDILYLLAEARQPLDIDAIANRLGVPKSSVYRIMRALRRRGLVHMVSEERGYSLGLVLLQWAEAVRQGLDLVQVAAPVLRTLAQQVGETAILTIFDGTHAVTVDVVANAAALRVAPPLGRANPLHCGAASKAILAWLPEERWSELLGKEPFPAFTDKTIRDFVKLRADLRGTRSRGYAISAGEVYEGAKAVGAPVFDERGVVCASLAIAGPRHRLGDDRLRAAALLVQKEARGLSAALGFRGAVVSREQAQRADRRLARMT
jgi:DNA-binding IclR family transcriptional regulator